MTKIISFEKVLSELEEIVQQLEKGDLSLDDSLKKFEKGIHLARQCQDTLTEAEQKITFLSDNQQRNTPSPNPTTNDEPPIDE